MKDRTKPSLWERYLTKEIGIEFKACLYFFAILVYYCTYRIYSHKVEASILHMAEQIFLCYIMGYVQVFLMKNFDEAEKLGKTEIFFLILCSLIFTFVSYLGKWFDSNLYFTIGFFFWMILLYFCCFLVYKSRRKIDEKILNYDLKLFQARQNSKDASE